MSGKGISSIQYNFINLPNEINMGFYSPFDVNHTYRADGSKLRKNTVSTVSGYHNAIVTTEVTDYLDGFQYKNTKVETLGGGGGPGDVELLLAAPVETRRAMEMEAFYFEFPVEPADPGIINPIGGIAAILKTQDLQFFPTAEGFYDYQKNQYIYQYKDHLGNNRVSFARNSAGVLEITDANDYYPFGMNHLKTGNAFFGSGSYKNYKFQEQELQETGFYSFKWREYMPDVGRFFNIDPLAEKYPTWTPFAFSGNRVIDARELEGLEPDIINNSNGKMEVNYYTKVIPKEGVTEQQVNNHLSEVSTILSQNESLKINMIHSETATFGIDMTKTHQGYSISTNDKGEQVFTFVQGNAYQGNPTNQTINSGGEARTTAHEIAHGLGLPHIFTGVPAVVPNTLENKDNLLNSDANSGEGMTPATGTKLLPAQIDVMKKVIESVQPEKTNNDKPEQ